MLHIRNSSHSAVSRMRINGTEMDREIGSSYCELCAFGVRRGAARCGAAPRDDDSARRAGRLRPRRAAAGTCRSARWHASTSGCLRRRRQLQRATAATGRTDSSSQHARSSRPTDRPTDCVPRVFMGRFDDSRDL